MRGEIEIVKRPAGGVGLAIRTLATLKSAAPLFIRRRFEETNNKTGGAVIESR